MRKCKDSLVTRKTLSVRLFMKECIKQNKCEKKEILRQQIILFEHFRAKGETHLQVHECVSPIVTITLKLTKPQTLKIFVKCSLFFYQSRARPCNRRK